MRRRLCLLSCLVAVACGAAAQPALACSCMAVGPVCQAYWKTDAVFDAVVLDIQPRAADTANPYLSDTIVTLNVLQSWKGPAVGPVRVMTSRFESSCGYAFKKGVRYLVFARHGSEGHLQVSLCSATREYDGTGAVAAFLASLGMPSRGGYVFGTVQTSTWVAESATGNASAVTRVRLFSSGMEKSVDSLGGRYEFTDVPNGRYFVEVTVPDGYTTYQRARHIEIVDSHACAEENFTFAAAGRVFGNVVDSTGRRMAQLLLELVSADTPIEQYRDARSVSAYTGNDGSFAFTEIPPGRYVLGINLRDIPRAGFIRYPRTVYPAPAPSPQILALALGQTVDIGTWQLPPPLEVVQLQGLITWSDGTPAAGVYVSVLDHIDGVAGDTRGAGGARSDDDGRFAIPVLRGRTYTFVARDPRILRSPPFSISAPRVEIGEGAPEVVRIILRAPRQD